MDVMNNSEPNEGGQQQSRIALLSCSGSHAGVTGHTILLRKVEAGVIRKKIFGTARSVRGRRSAESRPLTGPQPQR